MKSAQLQRLFFTFAVFMISVLNYDGDGGGGHWLVWMEWRPAGWSVCLPLLISPCTTKSRSSLLAPAHLDGPGKRAVKRLWCGMLFQSRDQTLHLMNVMASIPCQF